MRSRARLRRCLRCLLELLELRLEVRDALARAAAADLELRLAGAAPADAAGEARERVVLSRRGAASRYFICASSTWSLPSRLSARCAKMSRMSCVRSMTFEIRERARSPRTASGQVAVEDEHLDVELHRAQDDVLELAACRARTSDRSDRAPGAPCRRPRRPRCARARAARASDVVRRSAAWRLSQTCTRMARPSFASTRAGARDARELLLDASVSTDSGLQSSREYGIGAVAAVRRLALHRPRRGRGAPSARTSAWPSGERQMRGDEIEPQAREVDEVVARERLAAQVRVHEAQAAEAPLRAAQTTDVRAASASPRRRRRRSRRVPSAIDERADLTAVACARPRRASASAPASSG